MLMLILPFKVHENVTQSTWFTAGFSTGSDEAVANASPKQWNQTACHAGLWGRLQQVGKCFRLSFICCVHSFLVEKIHDKTKEQGKRNIKQIMDKCVAPLWFFFNSVCVRWSTWVTTRIPGQYFWRLWIQSWQPVGPRYPSLIKTVSVLVHCRTFLYFIFFSSRFPYFTTYLRIIFVDKAGVFICHFRWCHVVLENVWSQNKKLKLLWTYLHTYILQNK